MNAQAILRGRELGLSLDHPADLEELLNERIDPPGEPPPARVYIGPDGVAREEITVQGTRTIGDRVTKGMLDLQTEINSYDETTRMLVKGGLWVLRAGPVGALAGYAVSETVNAGIELAGVGDDVAEAFTWFGEKEMAVLSSTEMEHEQKLAADEGPGQALLMVQATETILGLGITAAAVRAGLSFRVSGVLSRGQVQRIMTEATHNPGSSVVMLGKSGTYSAAAAGMQATYFKLPNSRWREMTPEQAWQVNKAFLDAQVAQGKRIFLSNDPNLATRTFGLEVSRLTDLSFRFEKRDWYWEAVR